MNKNEFNKNKKYDFFEKILMFFSFGGYYLIKKDAERGEKIFENIKNKEKFKKDFFKNLKEIDSEKYAFLVEEFLKNNGHISEISLNDKEKFFLLKKEIQFKNIFFKKNDVKIIVPKNISIKLKNKISNIIDFNTGYGIVLYQNIAEILADQENKNRTWEQTIFIQNIISNYFLKFWNSLEVDKKNKAIKLLESLNNRGLLNFATRKKFEEILPKNPIHRNYLPKNIINKEKFKNKINNNEKINIKRFYQKNDLNSSLYYFYFKEDYDKFQFNRNDFFVELDVDLNKLKKQLKIKFHPDKEGGDIKIFKKINSEGISKKELLEYVKKANIDFDKIL